MPAEDRAGRAVGVDRLQPGDHAFLAFSDDEDRWDVLTVFTQQGFARDEKVALLVDVGHSPDWVAARVAGGAAAARARAARAAARRVERAAVRARRNSMPRGWWRGCAAGSTPRSPRGSPGCAARARCRSRSPPIDHLGQAVEYETALHAALFRGQRQEPRDYTALCYWDERLFGGTEAMAAAR